MNDALKIVSKELLEALAQETAPTLTGVVPASSSYTSRLLVEKWLSARSVEYRKKNEADGRGRTVYVLKTCPFDASHADPDSCIMQAPDGKMAAHCFHDSCKGQGWKDFKAKLGPPDADHYDPPLTQKGGKKKEKREEQNASAMAAGTVLIDPSNITVRETMRTITCTLLNAGDCYRRSGQVVRVTGEVITPILESAELAGLLNLHAEVLIVNEEGSEYRPLPTNYAKTWLKHPGESARLPAINLFTLNPVYTLEWRPTPPGYDRATGTYYAGAAVEPRSGTEHLDRLLGEFCFKSHGDRTNYIGMLLTTVLMPHFVGAKPMVLFNGNQPGLGKSILAQILAILRDGRPTETATYNPNDEEFEKRLGACVKRGATTIIIDNAKARGPRSPRIESACLERSITDPILSFRLLGYSTEIRAENSHIFCLTANTPDVSPDLVTRSVTVSLYFEGDPKHREFQLPDPEDYALTHRRELQGELLGLVERWIAAGQPPGAAPTRFNKKGWGRIIAGILATANQRDFLANADEVAAELDDSRREFAYLVGVMADHPQGTWTAAQLAELAQAHRLFSNEMRDASEHGRATRIGRLVGRFVDERFDLQDGRQAQFRRDEKRKGMTYHVAVKDDDSTSIIPD